MIAPYGRGSVGFLCLLGVVGFGQTQDDVRVTSHDYVPQSLYTLRVDTKLVEIAAVVRDGHGKAISGLTKDDFRILDDGNIRLIDHFVVDNASNEAINDHTSASAPEALKSGVPATSARPPRFLALFFDDINGTDGALANGLKQTQAAAKKFVKGVLKGDARIGIFTASGAQTVEFTAEEAKLIDAISAVKAHMKMKEDGLAHCPRVTPYYAFRIAYEKDLSVIRAVQFDASQKDCTASQSEIMAQADETWRQVNGITIDTLNAIGRVVVHLGTMPGRRELLLASSGFLAGPNQELKDKIIDRALRSDVVINALDAKGIYNEAQPGVRPTDQGFTESLSGSTAAANQWIRFETLEMPLRLEALSEPMGTLADGTGGVFFHNNNDVNAGFRELGGEPAVTYRLSFRPEGVAPDGGYHKLKVTLIHSKNYSVQARPGYFAPNEKAPESLQSRIDREILAQNTVAEFPMGIVVQGDKSALSVVVSFDISKFKFAKNGEFEVQRIIFTTALIDGQGKVAAAKEGQMDLTLTDAAYKRLAAAPVKATITLSVPAGVYTLREVAEESVEGKIACSSHSIEVK